MVHKYANTILLGLFAKNVEAQPIVNMINSNNIVLNVAVVVYANMVDRDNSVKTVKEQRTANMEE